MSHSSTEITHQQELYFLQVTTTYLPTESDLDAALSANVSVTFMSPLQRVDVDAKAVKVQNTVFFSPPFVRLLLNRNLPPIQAQACLCSAIIIVGLVKEYKPLLDWPRVVLVCIGLICSLLLLFE